MRPTPETLLKWNCSSSHVCTLQGGSIQIGVSDTYNFSATIILSGTPMCLSVQMLEPTCGVQTSGQRCVTIQQKHEYQSYYEHHEKPQQQQQEYKPKPVQQQENQHKPLQQQENHKKPLQQQENEKQTEQYKPEEENKDVEFGTEKPNHQPEDDDVEFGTEKPEYKPVQKPQQSYNEGVQEYESNINHHSKPSVQHPYEHSEPEDIIFFKKENIDPKKKKK